MSCGHHRGCGNRNVIVIIIILLLLCSGHGWGNRIC